MATRQLFEAHPIAAVRLYVCGITPYDATHIGHAAAYLAYDTLIRLWLGAGYWRCAHQSAHVRDHAGKPDLPCHVISADHFYDDQPTFDQMINHLSFVV